MRYLVIAALLLAGCNRTWTCDVHLADGSTESFNLYNRPRIYDDGALVLGKRTAFATGVWTDVKCRRRFE